MKYDIGYGGAFYALVDTHQLNMDVSHTPIHQLVRAADAISSAVKKSIQLEHPESADLAFLYGTILTDGREEYSEEPTANLCVFAECEVQEYCLVASLIIRTTLKLNLCSRYLE